MTSIKQEKNKEEQANNLVQSILESAMKKSASDIHFSPQKKRIDVFFRLEGKLKKVEEINNDIYCYLLTRIKFMSGLDVTQTEIPQDGRSILEVDKESVDFRISILPTCRGEKITIRILRTSEAVVDMNRVLTNKKDLEEFQKILNKPYGMVLICGPTGSGKTTTLYSALDYFAKRETMAIHTVEDPVEYLLDGVNHTQVKVKSGMTFLNSLKTVMRHDPDVICVGEIRDEENMEYIATIARTGHLILSSLHTGSIAETIKLLLDLKVEISLMSSILSGIICQKLIRNLCKHCSEDDLIDVQIIKSLGLEANSKVKKAIGCDKCNNTGYRGRFGVYEIFNPSKEVKKMMINNDEKSLMEYFLSEKHQSLKSKAIEALIEGKTSVEEIERVFN
ncbi:MAG: general secretion pathway protein GspE [Candidatus Cloacimonadota bacterium]|nr:MAG: general secretion pathway protein GspE [Candidatus Cloacimonadota bacterium]